MRVVWSADTLHEYVERATRLSPDHPVVISKFEVDAQEIELDAVARDGDLVVWAVSEHVEKAGVHSGDATLVFPALDLPQHRVRQVREIGRTLARALRIAGPFNLQLLVTQNGLKVIESNVRASRSFPFVSKALGVNFSREAMRAMLGEGPSAELVESRCEPDYVSVKAPQFSFDRLRGAHPTLGVEMTSTGEVAAFGNTKAEALLKAMLASGFKLEGSAPAVRYGRRHLLDRSRGCLAARAGTRSLRLAEDRRLALGRARGARSPRTGRQRGSGAAERIRRCRVQRVRRSERLESPVEPHTGATRDRSGHSSRWRGRAFAQRHPGQWSAHHSNRSP
jgi:Carbamoyl-phosphate synthase L chain, ATP binding domain